MRATGHILNVTEEIVGTNLETTHIVGATTLDSRAGEKGGGV